MSYRLFNDDEIQELYRKANNVIEQLRSSTANKSLSLDIFERTTQGQEALTIKVNGFIGGNVTELADLMKKRIPGSQVYMEQQPDTTQKILLHLPILHHYDKRKHSHNVRNSLSGPSKTVGTFLAMFCIIIAIIIWFRTVTVQPLAQ